MPAKDTFTVFTEDSHIGSPSLLDHNTTSFSNGISKKKYKKLERKIDKLLKPEKKSKKSKGKGKGNGKKHKNGKGTGKSDLAYEVIRETTSTGLRIVEMCFEAKFFPDGRRGR